MDDLVIDTRPGMRVERHQPLRMAESVHPTFKQWMEQVDYIVEMKVALSVHDLTDQPYRDWYDDRISPARAAGRALRANAADF